MAIYSAVARRMAHKPVHSFVALSLKIEGSLLSYCKARTNHITNNAGPKGFAISSFSHEVSTIEPFLIDEKRITPKYVVFWVYKRLAGQGILPVWKEEEGEEEDAK